MSRLSARTPQRPPRVGASMRKAAAASSAASGVWRTQRPRVRLGVRPDGFGAVGGVEARDVARGAAGLWREDGADAGGVAVAERLPRACRSRRPAEKRCETVSRTTASATGSSSVSPEAARSLWRGDAERLAEALEAGADGLARARGAEVAEDGARADARELVGVAEEDEPRAGAQRRQQRVEQEQVGHGRLVHHDDVGRDGRGRVAAPRAARRRVAQEAVQRDGLLRDPLAHLVRDGQRRHARCDGLAEAVGGLARRRRERDAQVGVGREEQREELRHGRRLARPRPAGHDGEAVPQRPRGRQRLPVASGGLGEERGEGVRPRQRRRCPIRPRATPRDPRRAPRPARGGRGTAARRPARAARRCCRRSRPGSRRASGARGPPRAAGSRRRGTARPPTPPVRRRCARAAASR